MLYNKLIGINMIVSISIVRYKPLMVPFALLAMAIHRIPLSLNPKCRFWKLMGNGKDGTFDLQPDWQQWATLTVWNSIVEADRFNEKSFISWWWKFFCSEKLLILCVPLASHGQWNGNDPFKMDLYDKNSSGPVAVLTRASIRLNKLKAFWSNVDPVAKIMSQAKGYITSFGIGEVPFFRQGTFSVWDSMEAMKAFAYQSKEHAEVIKKTRKENWYSEELFARFKIVSCSGSLKGKNPLDYIEIKPDSV